MKEVEKMRSRKLRVQRRKNVVKRRLIKGTGALMTLLFFSTGMTYSWFTSDTSTEKQEIAMGSLEVSGQFNTTNITNAYPGQTLDFEGQLENKGSLDAFMKVENRSEILFANSSVPVPDTTNVVQISFGPSEVNLSDPDVTWYRSKSKPTERYVELKSGKSVRVKTVAQLDGNQMGNNFNGAKINLSVSGKATQILDPAIKSVFGVDRNDLEKLTAADEPQAPTNGE